MARLLVRKRTPEHRIIELVLVQRQANPSPRHEQGVPYCTSLDDRNGRSGRCSAYRFTEAQRRLYTQARLPDKKTERSRIGGAVSILHRGDQRMAMAAARSSIAFALLLGALAVAPMARADVSIPAGGIMGLASGGVDAACTDLIVTGTMNLDTGAFVNVRDVIVQPGGVLNGGSGSITLSRNFTVLPGGQYNVQGSSVAYNTNCGLGGPQTPIPTLDSGMLIALSAALALLATFFLGGVQRRRDTIRGVGK